MPQLLNDVGEYGDRIQNTIKAGDWQQAQADLTRLQQSAQQAANQLTLLTSQLNAQMAVPTNRTVNGQHSTEAVSVVK